VNEEKDLKKKILIAEDDPISRRLLEVFLTRWGYQVSVAASGIEALELLEKADAPRLAVLDWMMPGLEGVQVCRKIRERKDRPYIYILLLSARTQKEDLLLGLESGADDYLTKPFDAQELRARLHVGQRILQLQDGLMVAGAELLFRATHDSLTGIARRDSRFPAPGTFPSSARRRLIRYCSLGRRSFQVGKRHLWPLVRRRCTAGSRSKSYINSASL
jgi:DNA-binding response OmpR family regulator